MTSYGKGQTTYGGSLGSDPEKPEKILRQRAPGAPQTEKGKIMMDKAKRSEICAYSMRRDKIEGESGFSSTSMLTNTASDTLKGNDGTNDRPHGADEWQGTPETKVRKEGAAMTDKKITPDGTATLAKALDLTLEATAKKTLKIDVARYQAYLDDPDLTQDQKEQIIGALWQIIVCFVDLGYGVSTLEEACGEAKKKTVKSGTDRQDVVECEASTLTDKFNTYAAE